MFNKAFSFNGRIRRTEFGISYIMYWIGYMFILFMNGQADIKFWNILFIPLAWFLLAQGAKRCHDLGKSGWWQIIPFYVLWMLFQKGQPFTNEYDISTDPFYGAEDYEKPFTIDEQTGPAISAVGEHGNTETPIT